MNSTNYQDNDQDNHERDDEQDDFEYVRNQLLNGSAEDRVITLNGLWSDPFADARLLPYLQPLLQDTTPCMVSIPFEFAELRWVAINALIAEQNACGVFDDFHINGVTIPYDSQELSQVAKRAGYIGKGSGVSGQIDEFAAMRAQGFLETVDIVVEGGKMRYTRHAAVARVV